MTMFVGFVYVTVCTGMPCQYLSGVSHFVYKFMFAGVFGLWNTPQDLGEYMEQRIKYFQIILNSDFLLLSSQN